MQFIQIKIAQVVTAVLVDFHLAVFFCEMKTVDS